MTTRSKLHLALAAAGLAAVLAGGALAQGRSAESLRAGGQVGEQADGFLGCVSSCTAEVRSAVAEINARRAEAYRRAAAEAGDGATAEAAGQAAFRQIFARLPSGQYYRPLNGGWTRK